MLKTLLRISTSKFLLDVQRLINISINFTRVVNFSFEKTNSFSDYLFYSFPSPKPVEDSKTDDEVPWSETAPEILHLNDDTFDNALKENPSVMVMFYAPCML